MTSLLTEFSGFFLLYETDKFHVAVLVFSNRSQKNQNVIRISVTHSAIVSCATPKVLFLPNIHCY